MGGRGGASAISAERMRQDLDALMREQAQLGPEQQIQRAIRDLMTPNARWVDIADVRDRVNMSRAGFDDLIRRMSLGSNAVLAVVPEENQKTLTPHRRRGAVDIGGEPNHLIRIRS